MIKSLQGLRALAMLAIFFFHAGFIPNGIFPVTFFFILSGFVLYYNYNNTVKDISIKKSILWGMKKIKKMYPIHIITFIMSIFIRFSWICKFSIGELIVMGGVNLLLLQTLTPRYSFTFNNLSWYLSTTFCCYLLAAFIIKKLSKVKVIKPIYLLILVWLIQILLAFIVPSFVDDYGYFFYISPYFRILDFILGMILAKIYIERNKDVITNYTLVEIGIISIFFITYLLSFVLPTEFTKGIIYAPVFLMGIYIISQEKGIISKFLCNKVFQKIAKISFEFYMVHELILILFRNLFSDFQYNYLIKITIIAIPSFIISYVIAIILNKFITNGKEYVKKSRRGVYGIN
ncbi:acyltransferase [Clostridium sp. NSJ-49]|uniref:acyltransferase family protein n=1 Tax=Clostridium TaxID=1485 RepID=UPI00164C2A03|nr:acyltransferase [Clostridium sp. NSJ-49]MBC5624035.1 acyltransferase [Clostridium sp. NSJ-49]